MRLLRLAKERWPVVGPCLKRRPHPLVSTLRQNCTANPIHVQLRYDPLLMREAILWIVIASLAAWMVILKLALMLV